MLAFPKLRSSSKLRFIHRIVDFRLLLEIRAQVLPLRVHLPDQRELLRPRPSLDFRLTFDRGVDVPEMPEPDKHTQIVAARERLSGRGIAMLPNPSHKAVGHADIERCPRFVGDDVNEVVVHGV